MNGNPAPVDMSEQGGAQMSDKKMNNSLSISENSLIASDKDDLIGNEGPAIKKAPTVISKEDNRETPPTQRISLIRKMTDYFESEYHENYECHICSCEFVVPSEVSILACTGKHIFHNECIDSWILHQESRCLVPSCPMCKKEILREEIRKKMFRGFTSDAMQRYQEK